MRIPYDPTDPWIIHVLWPGDVVQHSRVSMEAMERALGDKGTLRCVDAAPESGMYHLNRIDEAISRALDKGPNLLIIGGSPWMYGQLGSKPYWIEHPDQIDEWANVMRKYHGPRSLVYTIGAPPPCTPNFPHAADPLPEYTVLPLLSHATLVAQALADDARARMERIEQAWALSQAMPATPAAPSARPRL